MIRDTPRAIPSERTRGKPRVDDRRVISGIVHLPKFGWRWIDAPAGHGSRKRLYRHFVRWACGPINCWF